MTNIVFASALTLALAVSGTAFAQSTTGANPPSPAATNQPKANQQSALTVEKLQQDLQKAGFTDVKVLEDAFLIQAKTKDGNPILLTVGPNGMSTLEVSNASAAESGADDGTDCSEPQPCFSACEVRPAIGQTNGGERQILLSLLGLWGKVCIKRRRRAVEPLSVTLGKK